MANQGWSADAFLEKPPSADSDRVHAILDWLAVAAICACLWMFDRGWYHGPLQAKWVAVGALALVGLAKFALASHRGRTRFDAFDGFALLLLAWVGVSLLWTANTLGGYETAVKWALLTAVFLGLRRETAPGTRTRLAVGIGAGLLGILLIDRLRIAEFGSYFNQNYQTEALLLGLPFLFIFTGKDTAPRLRWTSRAIIAFIAFFLVFLNPSKIEYLVLAGCGVFFGIALLWGKSKSKALGIASLVILGTAALVVFGWDRPLLNESHGFRESVYPRLELLANGIAMWRDAPFLGQGAGFMYPVYPLFQERYTDLLGADYKTVLFTSFYFSAGTLHNDIVQFLAGFGLIGLAIVVVGIYRARRSLGEWRSSRVRIAGAVVVVAALVNATVDFPLQNAASAMLAVLGLAWLAAEPLPTAQSAGASLLQRLRLLPMLGLIAAIPAVGWWGYRYYIGHDAFGASLRIGQVRPDIASLQLNLGAIGAYPLDDAIRYQAYSTLMFLEENSKQPVASPEMHDQIFATSLTTGPGNALMIFRLEYLLNSGRYKERPEEVAKWRKQLTTHVTHLPDTWLMEALYEVADNQPDKARAALDRYFKLTGGNVSEDRRGIVEHIRQRIAG